MMTLRVGQLHSKCISKGDKNYLVFGSVSAVQSYGKTAGWQLGCQTLLQMHFIRKNGTEVR